MSTLVGQRTIVDVELLLQQLAATRHRGSLARRDWQPLQHQKPDTQDWDVWLILGGRGTGKTRAGAEYVLEHLNTQGADARVGIGAPTAADVRDVCAEGVSGLITIARDQFTSYNRSLGEAHHHRGGYVKFLGAEEPARWNGPQWSLLWADELALWNQDTWEQAQFGLRLGDRPRAIATTTPKARQFVRDLAERHGTHVTRARTAENPYLSEIVRQRLYDRYGGTRLGRQELEAEWLDDVPGALWQRDQLEKNRRIAAPDLLRVVVAIDPSGGDDEGHAECGIIAAGKGADGHGYVLRDVSERLSPERWARRAVQLYHELKADRLLAEANFGGAMVQSTIRAVDPSVPLKLVNASRGKRVRAEPVAALDEQGKIHHVGMLATLEDQLCLAGGSLIATRRGDVPIETVTVHDWVWTRTGWRQVRWAGQTGRAPTIRLITDVASLRCTASHPVYVEGLGFVPAGEVHTAHRIPMCRRPSNVRSSTSRVSATSWRTTAITAQLALADDGCITETSGLACMDPYLTSGRFTTATTIEPTTTSRISLRSASQHTSRRTHPAVRLESHQKSNQRSGALNGLDVNPGWLRASAAASSMRRQVNAPCSVPSHAVVVGIESTGVTEPVFNLTVDGEHEYFANGLLTHNCSWVPDNGDPSPDRLDARVWALTELLLGGSEVKFY